MSVDKLKSLIEKIAKDHNYRLARIAIDPITSGGANYTTNLYLVTIAEPLKPDINLFAKVANLNEEIRNNNELLANVYKIEAMFYTELAVNFERLYKKNNVPAEYQLTMPKYYGHDLTRLEEIMILENLEAKGFKSFDRMKTFNWEYAATAVQQMARFHALGLALRDENPAEFEKVVNEFQTNPLGDQEVSQMIFEQAIANGCQAVGREYAERLQKYFGNKESMTELMELFMAEKTMLIHGDFRPSNLMHRRKVRLILDKLVNLNKQLCFLYRLNKHYLQNGKIEVIPLDYQTLRLGNPVGDLMHFIFSGSDEEFRRLHYRRLLDHYHAELTLALQRLQVDVEKVYSKATYEQDLHKMRPVGLILGLTMAAVVTVAPEDAPKLEGDLMDISVKPNELARQRILGVVRDYVRWGVL